MTLLTNVTPTNIIKKTLKWLQVKSYTVHSTMNKTTCKCNLYWYFDRILQWVASFELFSCQCLRDNFLNNKTIL